MARSPSRSTLRWRPSRSLNFMTFPPGLTGRASINSTRLSLYLAIRDQAQRRISSGSGSGSSPGPALATTKATPSSPIRSSGTPRPPPGRRPVAEQDGLDLGGVRVEPAHHEHVLLPVGDVDVAVGVDEADVAGLQPAVLDGRLGGGLVVEVLLHHVEASDDELSGRAGGHVGSVVVDHAHLDTGQRTTHGVGDHLRRVVVAAHADRAGRLGHGRLSDAGLTRGPRARRAGATRRTVPGR